MEGEGVNKYNSVRLSERRERQRESAGESNAVERGIQSDPAELSIFLKQARSAGEQGHGDSKPHTYTNTHMYSHANTCSYQIHHTEAHTRLISTRR